MKQRNGARAVFFDDARKAIGDFIERCFHRNRLIGTICGALHRRVQTCG